MGWRLDWQRADVGEVAPGAPEEILARGRLQDQRALVARRRQHSPHPRKVNGTRAERHGRPASRAVLQVHTANQVAKDLQVNDGVVAA